MLDLTDQVVVEGEGGLLGVAVAPDGRHLYVSFTDAEHAVRLVEVALDGDEVDPATRPRGPDHPAALDPTPRREHRVRP